MRASSRARPWRAGSCVLVQHPGVVVVGAGGVVAEEVEDLGGFVALEEVSPALPIDGALGGEVFGGGEVELAVEDRIAGGDLVHVGGAVADPLAGDEDG